MLGESLLTLAALAGQMVVDAAVSDGWETAEYEYAQLLGRGDAMHTQLAERWLKETHEQLAGDAGTSTEMIRMALAVRWAGRWADLLEEDPDAEAELRTLVQQIQAALPTEKPSASDHAVSANGEVSSYAAGPEHPGALATQSELAYSAGQAGDAAAARDQFAALIRVRERVFGADSPDTLAARFNLAYWTGRAGAAASARDQFAALLPIRERIYGPDHLETLAAREELAYWTGCAGAAASARDQFAALLSFYEGVLGAEHPETLAVWYQLAHWTALAGDEAATQD